MRIDDNSNVDASSSNWVTLKEQGKSAFERGDYQTAISKYGVALRPDKNCPSAERQIILSNMVAARLKIGGPAQAEAAVENAKQVSYDFLFSPWSKDTFFVTSFESCCFFLPHLVRGFE